jgi:hypothetical protein
VTYRCSSARRARVAQLLEARQDPSLQCRSMSRDSLFRPTFGTWPAAVQRGDEVSQLTNHPFAFEKKIGCSGWHRGGVLLLSQLAPRGWYSGIMSALTVVRCPGVNTSWLDPGKGPGSRLSASKKPRRDAEAADSVMPPVTSAGRCQCTRG